ncbi:hypothetical protein L211DRAFT_837954 [Terfezia boudieri ATCC MYA-4762]|uniref:Uncharacterized protein n=1 Tax=Terfezia boudieri ATCC MYA-4762 TaxID=1051890 RepID=A0A3N4LMD8_9PEZI|nr:hypothetical protein L211DRAFT_837954 [Terfezia boudieri ATCC MYA-4762]
MRPGIYYYYTRGWSWEQAPYPIKLSVFNWEYKEDVIPNEWNISQNDSDMRGNPPSTYHHLVEIRDKDCRITGWEKYCQGTHLMPQTPVRRNGYVPFMPCQFMPYHDK